MIDFFEAIKTTFQADKRYKQGIEKGYHPIDRKLYKGYNSFRPNGPKPLFCYLPFNSLTFSFRGQVFVCSYNRDVELGKYPDNSIDEIWNGEEANKLREHMQYNDLDYGCRHCKYFFDKGKFTNLRPLVFDKYYQNTEATFPQVFEFELSNECNLECQMCAGEVSSSIRKNRDKLPPIPTPYDDNFVTQLEKYIPKLKEAKFYGGEPFLIPIYYKIWDKIKELNPKLELFVITNGSHYNSKIEQLLEDLNFDMAVSIDAVDKEKLERIRKNVIHEKLMTNIKRFSEICTRKGKHLSLSFTVQKDNWDQFPLVLKLCNEMNAYIYVSYLERPMRFALTNSTREELQEVRAYMDKFTFPKSTPKEQHNARCFEDYKNFLDEYIRNADVKKYHEYDFISGKTESVPVKTEVKNEQSTLVSEKDFKDWLTGVYAANAEYETKFAKDKLLEKLNSVLEVHNEDSKKNIYYHITRTSFNQVMNTLQNHTVEEIRLMIGMISQNA
ncbi:MAG TPA: twitch domain-containing radical SAM protein [Chitinophagales bacterium]|nr:twitch domain-containing radical SAM protein [Chitinophagales bacterium]